MYFNIAKIHNDLDFNDALVLNQISKECPFARSPNMEFDLINNKDSSNFDVINEEIFVEGEVKRKGNSIIKHLEIKNIRKSTENNNFINL